MSTNMCDLLDTYSTSNSIGGKF